MFEEFSTRNGFPINGVCADGVGQVFHKFPGIVRMFAISLNGGGIKGFTHVSIKKFKNKWARIEIFYNSEEYYWDNITTPVGKPMFRNVKYFATKTEAINYVNKEA